MEEDHPVQLIALQLLWLVAPSIPWLGKLPGDIVIERENFQFYSPVMTCILLSIVLTEIRFGTFQSDSPNHS